MAQSKVKTKQKTNPSLLIKDWVPLEHDVVVCSGTIHQVHKTLKYRDEQGAAVCVVACAFASLKKMGTWSSKTLDQIIELGSKLYVKTKQVKSVDVLTPSEVYKCFCWGNLNVTMKVEIQVQQMKIKTMEDHLVRFFNCCRTGIVGFGQVYVAVWKIDRFFFMFNPLEHDSKGDRWRKPPFQGVCSVKILVGITPLAENILKNIDLTVHKRFVLYCCSVDKVIKSKTKSSENLDGDILPPFLMQKEEATILPKPEPEAPAAVEEGEEEDDDYTTSCSDSDESLTES